MATPWTHLTKYYTSYNNKVTWMKIRDARCDLDEMRVRPSARLVGPGPAR